MATRPWPPDVRRLALSLALAACGPSSTPQAGPHDASELPVTRVVLFQNGVGYFERRGTVDGDRVVIQVRPEQLNDLLTSLTIVDQSGGRAVSVGLPLEKTGAQQLAELPEQVQQAGGLLAVLAAFRGARVAIDGEEGEIAGRVLGVEQGDAWRVTLKADDGVLHVYPVAAIERVELLDSTLSVGLDKSLDVALGEARWKPLALDIRLAGAKSHDLTISYVLPMPVWKPAYRVVLGDGKPLLQGWAVVDNISGEDWRSVSLSLVAGMPISFIYDLHSPQFVARADLTSRRTSRAPTPVVERPAYEVPAPAATAAPGMAPAPPPSAPSAGSGTRTSKKKMAAEAYGGDSRSEDSYALDRALEEQLPPSARGESVGALFRYDLTDGVDVPDRSSTMVAIVNSRVTGKEGVLFRPGEAQAYRVVAFTNETGSTLETGPVAIYSGGTFVGEGFLERLDPGALSFVNYALEGRVRLDTQSDNREEGFRLVRIVDGLIETTAQSVRRTTYKVENKYPEAVTAFVKAQKLGGDWSLVKQPAGTMATADAFYFPVSAPPSGRAELAVEWQTPIKKQIAIDTEVSTSVLKLYLGSGKASPAVTASIEQILSVKGRMSAIATEDRELSKQHSALSTDQQRVRDNLELLRKSGGNKPLQQELFEKLSKLETELGRLSGRLVRLSEERAELQGKLTMLIKQVVVDER